MYDDDKQDEFVDLIKAKTGLTVSVDEAESLCIHLDAGQTVKVRSHPQHVTIDLKQARNLKWFSKSMHASWAPTSDILSVVAAVTNILRALGQDAASWVPDPCGDVGRQHRQFTLGALSETIDYSVLPGASRWVREA